jgi:HEAT repeat protein
MVPHLLEWVSEGEPPVAHAARMALEHIVGAASSDPSQADTVRRLLLTALALRKGSEDPARLLAIRLLGLIGIDDRRTAYVLKRAIREGGRVAEAALEAAQRIPGRRITEALIEALHRASPEQKVAVLLALGTRTEVRALPELIRWARRGTSEAQLAALRALGRLGSVRAVPALREVASSGPEAARRAAVDALLLIAGKAETDETTRAAILQAVRELACTAAQRWAVGEEEEPPSS